jgi:predicted small secreted protein
MKLFALTTLTFASLALSACANTLDGAGRDIENAGQAIQKTF